jgi:hypothetical protein
MVHFRCKRIDNSAFHLERLNKKNLYPVKCEAYLTGAKDPVNPVKKE